RRTGTAAPRPSDQTRYSPQNLVPLPPGATSGTVRRPSPQSLPGDHGEGRCHRLHGHGDAVHQPASREPAESPRTTPLTTQTQPAVDTYNVVRQAYSRAAPLRGTASGAPRAGLCLWRGPPGAPAPSPRRAARVITSAQAAHPAGT